jgi:selenocysteine-specific elongation factor
MPERIRPFVVGTAGHIDHGKTALIEQITDANPDRLPEEQERDLTIDLGFAEYVMPDGSEVGIIDVPGHERFIRNMVAGATAMDIVILVVAADDGVMPQTREHLEIMDVLDIDKGIPVITKIDLVDDVLVEVVEDELSDLLEGTFLEGVPAERVSSSTGEGYDPFIERFESLVEETPGRSPEGIFRMPIQRSFTVKGLGTVVTGVPVSGNVRTDEELVVEPDGSPGRVRGIQAHHRDIDKASAGHRTALNLAEVHHENVGRGDLICTPGYVEPGTVVDAEFRFNASGQDVIEHWDPIRLHVGSDECVGRIIPLEDPLISRGEEMLVQFELERPVAAVPGDPFVLRKQSPMITLGGGTILDVHEDRKTRSDHEHVEKLRSYADGCEDWRDRARLEAQAHGVTPFDLNTIATSCFVPEEEVEKWFAEQDPEKLGWIPVSEREYISEQGVREACDRVIQVLSEFHEQNPVLPGIQKHDLQNRTDLDPNVLETALESLRERDEIVRDQQLVRRSDHDASLPEHLTAARDLIEEKLQEQPFQTPSRDELKSLLDDGISDTEFDHLLQFMKQKQQVVEPETDVFFHASAIEEATELVRSRIKQNGSVETGEIRDALDTSRKYAIPLLEHLDQIGLTYRKDNKRYLVDKESSEKDQDV